MELKTARKAKTTRVKIPALTPEELTETATIRISRPKLKTAAIGIVGVSPYCQHAFSEKQRKAMEATQRAGQQARGKRRQTPVAAATPTLFAFHR